MIYETEYYVIKKLSPGGGFLSEYISNDWQPKKGQFTPETTCVFARSYRFTLHDGKRIVNKLNIEYGYGTDCWNIDNGKFIDWVLIKIDINYNVVWTRDDLINTRP